MPAGEHQKPEEHLPGVHTRERRKLVSSAPTHMKTSSPARQYPEEQRATAGISDFQDILIAIADLQDISPPPLTVQHTIVQNR